MADAKALPNLQALRSPSPAQTLPSEAVLDALKMILIGASLNEVLTSLTFGSQSLSPTSFLTRILPT